MCLPVILYHANGSGENENRIKERSRGTQLHQWSWINCLIVSEKHIGWRWTNMLPGVGPTRWVL